VGAGIGTLPRVPNALAGVGSVLWGTADFLGGFASAGWRAERVAGVSNVIGFGLLLGLAPVITGAPPPASEIAWGAVAGTIGSIGATLLYRSLAMGPMNVAAPTVGVVTAAVPAAIGLLQGERPGAVALTGAILAVVAVAIVGASGESGPRARPVDGPPIERVLAVAGLAGVGLGLANVAFAQTSADAGLWPVVTAKLVAALLLWSVVAAKRASDDEPASRRNVVFAAWTGIVDAGATMCVALALQRGSLVLVSVLASLFPAVTVLLARVALDERIGRRRAFGLVLAAAAVVMMVAG
jgi:drug/metabolite transporter (DMT)-like permease